MQQRARGAAAFPVAAVLAATLVGGCGGGGHGSSHPSSATSSATSSAAAAGGSTPTTGVDQATTDFCITMTQLVHIQNPVEFHAEVKLILTDAVNQAPASLKDSMRVLAGYIQAVADTTTVPIPANLAGATETVGAYLSAHCGITLPANVG